MPYSETRFVEGADHGVDWLVVGIVTLTSLLIGYLVFSATPSTLPPPLTSAHVKVELVNGHGSATHIGDGLYVTAAHVVGKSDTVKINGVDAVVLWANSAYDIALVSGPDTAAVVPLWCGVSPVGEVGVAHGNPTFFEDIATSLTVAGAAQQIADWKLAMPMDGSMGPGMSGGGWVVGGVLAGVNVGAALAPAGMGFPSYFGISIVVPSSVVCELLGRT